MNRMGTVIVARALPVLLGTALAAMVLGCGSGFSPANGASLQDAPGNRLACLSEENVLKMRSSRTAFALQPQLLQLYYGCENEVFRTRIPERISKRLTIEERWMIFSSILAHYSAPYGPSSEVGLFDLLQAKSLHCGSYALLSAELFRTVNKGAANKIVFVGFDGGAVGNHAQIIFQTENRQMLLDPTVGIVAFTNFNDLLTGKPLDESRVFSFYMQKELIENYLPVVTRALTAGEYRPSDLLYYQSDLAAYADFVRRSAKRDFPAYVGTLPTPASQYYTGWSVANRFDFHTREFSAGHSAAALCRAINGSGYHGITCTATELDEIVDFLNSVLRVSNFYDIWRARYGGRELPANVTALVAETDAKNSRRQVFNYLKAEKRGAVTELNRLLLELTYPDSCPKHSRDPQARSSS